MNISNVGFSLEIGRSRKTADSNEASQDYDNPKLECYPPVNQLNDLQNLTKNVDHVTENPIKPMWFHVVL